jgi:uncharacterized protein (TIGR03435 family)
MKGFRVRNISMRCLSTAFLTALIAVAAFGQSGQPVLSFEVAEIKLNTSGSSESAGDLSNGRLYVRNVPVRLAIAEAWSVTPNYVSGPSWLDDVRVDVVAKAPSPRTPDADLRLMLQTLLRDRMRMVAHMEQREQSVWALSVWKGHAKMTPSEMPAKPEDSDCQVGGGPTGGRLVCKHMTMAAFAHELPQDAGRYVDKRVVDQTGLEGAWEFTVEYTPLAQLETSGGVTLFAALQAQLGLQLENKKLPVPVVVIDSMARTPTEN